MPVVNAITRDQLCDVRRRSEGHFIDFKAKEITPAKVSRSIAAFQNSDGGELWIGIRDPKKHEGEWVGFADEEAANGLIQMIEERFGFGNYVTAEFIRCDGETGLIVHIEADKSPGVAVATDGTAYVRRGAQNIPVTGEALRRLELAKGVLTHEANTIPSDPTELEDSNISATFMSSVVPQAKPKDWLRKHKLIVHNMPTVAGLLLFSDEPQIEIPYATIKIARYNTSDAPAREFLSGVPDTVVGPAYECIRKAVEIVAEIAEAEPVMGQQGFEQIRYPREAIHEVITNAVIHRDYAINDAVHIYIFDNRIEVISPGRLPAHITPQNILKERFSRNPKIVHVLNKFPDPPNQDIGEGLNTAFEAMKKLSLRAPVVQEDDNRVIVTLKHERFAAPEVSILIHLHDQGSINNREARELTGIGSENRVKNIFIKMMDNGLIEKIPGLRGNKTAYKITAKGRRQLDAGDDER